MIATLFYMLSPDIDLRKNSNLRLLALSFICDHIHYETLDLVLTPWFDSLCESVTSNSLAVEVYGLPNEPKIWNKIQETLLALCARIGTLSIYIQERHLQEQVVDPEGSRRLFSRLYETGIVVEQALSPAEEVRLLSLNLKAAHAKCVNA